MTDGPHGIGSQQGSPQEPRRSLWRRAFDGQKWKGEADSKRVDITSAVVGLLVSAVLIGAWLPVSLNDAAIARENVRRCWDATIELRKSSYDLEDGFIVQPSAPVPRRADFRALQVASDNVGFACLQIPGFPDREARLKEAMAKSDELIKLSDDGEIKTGGDFQATGFTSDVRGWADDLLKRLAESENKPSAFQLWLTKNQ
jgi:hypothetical protein